MTDIIQYFGDAEKSFIDKRYLEGLKRVQIFNEDNGLQPDKGIQKRIDFIEKIIKMEQSARKKHIRHEFKRKISV